MVGRQPSIPVGDTQCIARESLKFPFDIGMFFVRRRLVLHLFELLLRWKTLHTSRAVLRPRTAEAVNVSANLHVASVSPQGSVAWICEFQTSEHGVDTRVVASSGFGSAAGFSMLKLRMLNIVDIHLERATTIAQYLLRADHKVKQR